MNDSLTININITLHTWAIDYNIVILIVAKLVTKPVNILK